MFQEALLSKIPIITVTTDDIANTARVIDYYLRDQQAEVQTIETPDDIDGYDWYLWFYDSEAGPEWISIYEKGIQKEACLIVVNPDGSVPMAFNAGELETPALLVKKEAKRFVGAKGLAPIMNALTGLTIKNAREILSLCQARHGSVSQGSITKVRNELFGNTHKGLRPVSTDMPFYVRNSKIDTWLAKERTFFFNAPDDRLRARGLLLDGPAGTGKTMAAKYIARSLKVPIYRLDMGGAMEKYVGVSETNLQTALDRVDREEPCVLLIDEVEKMLSTDDESGVVERMYAKILWWLQEHQSRVLTIMTTNDREKLKPELYREGRIDKVITMQGLTLKNALSFGYRVYKSFDGQLSKDPFSEILESKLETSGLMQNRISQAAITYTVYDIVKSHLND